MKSLTDGDLRLVDVMILIAATAAGFSMINWDTLKARNALASIAHTLPGYESEIAVVACPLCLAWTCAATAIRLRSPRPSLRCLARQPGWVASLSVLACVPIPLAADLFDIDYGPKRHVEPRIPYDFLYGLRYSSAYVVVGAWLALWLNRRWRPEPSAIDRLGRVLGFGWIAFFLLNRIALVVYSMGLHRLY